MNAAPFLIAAYVVALGGLAAIIFWAYASMRRAERAAGQER